MRRAHLVLLVAFLTACVNLRVETAHQPDFDFSSWKTFAIAAAPPPAVAAGDTSDKAPVNATIERELNRALGEKGYSRAEAGSADFVVHFHAGTWAKPVFNQEVGIEGRLQLRLFDRRTGEVAWEGHAHETWLSSMDSETEIRTAIDRLFADFPPGA